jgi:alkylation response protein AidB-like acyl-CoA dehydrogenase
MRFALTEDQVAFGDAVRALLAGAPRDDRATWDALVEMGVTSVLVPEADGGLGLDEVVVVAVLEEAGYAGLAFAELDDLLVPPGAAGGHRQASSSDRDRRALGAAAQLVGLGQRMLDMTVEHVKGREQFGVPIGSFQAVKHHLADALKELAFARPAVRRAAWSLATAAPTTTCDVSVAKALASDAASVVARHALQCHGAIGYTVEYDLHTYLKRTWRLARTHGDAAWHRARIYDELVTPGGSRPSPATTRTEEGEP